MRIFQPTKSKSQILTYFGIISFCLLKNQKHFRYLLTRLCFVVFFGIRKQIGKMISGLPPFGLAAGSNIVEVIRNGFFLQRHLPEDDNDEYNDSHYDKRHKD